MLSASELRPFQAITKPYLFELLRLRGSIKTGPSTDPPVSIFDFAARPNPNPSSAPGAPNPPQRAPLNTYPTRLATPQPFTAPPTPRLATPQAFIFGVPVNQAVTAKTEAEPPKSYVTPKSRPHWKEIADKFAPKGDGEKRKRTEKDIGSRNT
jgi:hypothetical protein